MSTTATTNFWSYSGRWEAEHKRRDALVHDGRGLRIVLEVFYGIRQTTVDFLAVVEEVGGEFLEPLEVFLKDVLPRMRIRAHRARLQFLEIEFRFLLFAFDTSIVLRFVEAQQS